MALRDGADDAAEVELIADEAEADAQAAEAAAEASRARARALRLRKQAEEALRAAAAEPAVEEGATEDAKAGDGTAEDGTAEDGTAAGELPDDTADAEPSPTRRRVRMPAALRRIERPSPARLAATVTILLTAALLAASGWMVWHHREVAAQDQLAAEFTAAAERGVVALTTLNFTTAEADVQRIVDTSTGSFKDDFEQRAADFTKVVQGSQVVTKGTVNATAIQSLSRNEAVVLVTSTEEVTNAAGAKGQPRPFRFAVTVVREDNELKMSKVEFLL
ncbi:hypothetical protein LV457_17955 [Mycobacterium sp. MYCO198283]|uniref:hypothetical protein n=1 Tax=Mycobacterium sp. MYCO198283 TaxID=2883505 RepID=UPI001E4BAC3F|nr:hypothetical protein [Mycobacterium sp. MYCO198283]MCG5434158.1 hypothetical protein [Mycobacterium sp. MYCO198283]